jgi:predicted neutral ceramidase superfamily lipid hydrolase
MLQLVFFILLVASVECAPGKKSKFRAISIEEVHTDDLAEEFKEHLDLVFSQPKSSAHDLSTALIIKVAGEKTSVMICSCLVDCDSPGLEREIFKGKSRCFHHGN